MVTRLNGIPQAVSSRLAMQRFPTKIFEGLASNGFVVQMMKQTERFSTKEMKRTNDNPKPSEMRTLEPRPKDVELLNMTRENRSVVTLVHYGSLNAMKKGVRPCNELRNQFLSNSVTPKCQSIYCQLKNTLRIKSPASNLPFKSPRYFF